MSVKVGVRLAHLTAHLALIHQISALIVTRQWQHSQEQIANAYRARSYRYRERV
jgi:hypothetical protein